MKQNTKDVKITLDYDVALSSITYTQLYLEQRISQYKASGRDYSQYEQELADINQALKSK